MKGADGLTLKQSQFIAEFLKDGHATNAAKRAGYSQKTAHVIANQLLKKPLIQQRLAERHQRRQERLELRTDDVLQELLRIAKSDLRALYDDQNQLKPLKDWPDDVAAAVSGLSREGQPRFWDKPKALELLARHLRLIDTSSPNPNQQPHITIAIGLGGDFTALTQPTDVVNGVHVIGPKISD